MAEKDSKKKENKELEENNLDEIEIRKKKIDGFGCVKGISPFTREDKMEDRDL